MMKRVHLMGIGGAGMSALAKLLKARGFEVTGCDLKTPHYDLGTIPVELSHSAGHVDAYRPDSLILSSAVSRDNPEVVRAKELGIAILSRAEALSSLFNEADGIGIAGTHGKTTTTSMTGLIFIEAGLDPTVYVGANVPDIGGNFLNGSGPNFIAELDESDGSFELFLPKVAIVTNVDWDHVDHYPSRESVIGAFTRFADGRKNGGTLIICAEDEGASRVFENCDKRSGKILRYGLGTSWDWGAYDLQQTHGGGISCKVTKNGQTLGTLTLKVSGEHNILNALAALAAADECGIPFSVWSKALGNFHGSERRMQVKGRTAGDVLVMDDYAHHPSEIRATLQAIRGIYPERRLVVIFQPHRFTRTAMFAAEIESALSMADESYILPVYSAGEKELPVNLKITRPEELKLELLPGDILLTMGAGDVYKFGEKFLNEV